jgi:hypothetical protein
MKKIFTFIAALAMTHLTASADHVWDFTVIPTQTIDGTGNITCTGNGGLLNDDGGASWSQIYNNGGTPDETEFTAKDGEVFEATKGLKWGILDSQKMVLWRNYPPAYGGCHLFSNSDGLSCTFPAKTGQYIVFEAFCAKNTRTISGMGIDAAISLEQAPATDVSSYQTVFCKVTEDNPYLTIMKNIYIRKIAITDTEPGTTGISQAKVVRQQADGAVCNLSGQNVGDDYKGIVIKNGRKMIQK